MSRQKNGKRSKFLKICILTGSPHINGTSAYLAKQFADGAMSDVLNYIKESDLIVFVTPLYFMGMSSWLKTVIDRFYSELFSFKKMNKLAILMMTCNDQTEVPITPLKLYYEALIDNLGWTNRGEIFAQGYNTREEIIDSDFAKQAYELGYSL